MVAEALPTLDFKFPPMPVTPNGLFQPSRYRLNHGIYIPPQADKEAMNDQHPLAWKRIVLGGSKVFSNGWEGDENTQAGPAALDWHIITMTDLRDPKDKPAETVTDNVEAEAQSSKIVQIAEDASVDDNPNNALRPPSRNMFEDRSVTEVFAQGDGTIEHFTINASSTSSNASSVTMEPFPEVSMTSSTAAAEAENTITAGVGADASSASGDRQHNHEVNGSGESLDEIQRSLFATALALTADPSRLTPSASDSAAVSSAPVHDVTHNGTVANGTDPNGSMTNGYMVHRDHSPCLISQLGDALCEIASHAQRAYVASDQEISDRLQAVGRAAQIGYLAKHIAASEDEYNRILYEDIGDRMGDIEEAAHAVDEEMKDCMDRRAELLHKMEALQMKEKGIRVEWEARIAALKKAYEDLRHQDLLMRAAL